MLPISQEGHDPGSTIRLFVASVPTIRPFRRTTRLGSRAPIMPAPMARATEFPPPVPRCDRSGSRSRLASPVGLRHEDGTARSLVVLLLCRDSVPPIVIPYSISSCWGATRSRVVPYEIARASGLTGAHLESPFWSHLTLLSRGSAQDRRPRSRRRAMRSPTNPAPHQRQRRRPWHAGHVPISKGANQ